MPLLLLQQPALSLLLYHVHALIFRHSLLLSFILLKISSQQINEFYQIVPIWIYLKMCLACFLPLPAEQRRPVLIFTYNTSTETEREREREIPQNSLIIITNIFCALYKQQADTKWNEEKEWPRARQGKDGAIWNEPKIKWKTNTLHCCWFLSFFLIFPWPRKCR